MTGRLSVLSGVMVAAFAGLATPWASGDGHAPKLVAPTKARIGEPIHAVGTGVKPRYTYRLVFDQLVADKKPGLECSRNIDRPYIVTGTHQRLRFRGRIPTTLACSRSTGGHVARTVTVKPGAYRWVLANKTGKASYNHAASIVVKRIVVTAN